jgi:hypothetical protein
MPREVKQGRRAAVEEASAPLARAVPAPLQARPQAELRPIASRSFAALDPQAAPPPPPAPAPPYLYGATALLVAAVLAAALPLPLGLRLGLPLLLVAAAALLARRRSAPPPAAAEASPARSVRVESGGLVFRPQPRQPAHSPSAQPAPSPSAQPPSAPPATAQPATLTLLDAEAPFGVTLLASRRRDRLVALLSSPAGTYYLGADCDAGARRALAPLLDRALTVSADDSALEAIGPDGEPLFFTPEDLASLVEGLLEMRPACLEGFVLTDARGAPLTFDGRQLRVGDRALDLSAPLDWRAILFQETFGEMVAFYQGTWVRQGSTELVIVSLLPSLGPPPRADLDLARHDHGVARDIRLMAHAHLEDPPPREQRVAIERLFMLPLRSALDLAPRASRQPDHAQA